jgi:hypothetical protein
MSGGGRFLGFRGTSTMILGLKVAVACLVGYIVMWIVRLSMGHMPFSPGYELIAALPFIAGASAGLYYFFHIPSNVDVTPYRFRD